MQKHSVYLVAFSFYVFAVASTEWSSTTRPHDLHKKNIVNCIFCLLKVRAGVGVTFFKDEQKCTSAIAICSPSAYLFQTAREKSFDYLLIIYMKKFEMFKHRQPKLGM